MPMRVLAQPRERMLLQPLTEKTFVAGTVMEIPPFEGRMAGHLAIEGAEPLLVIPDGQIQLLDNGSWFILADSQPSFYLFPPGSPY